MSQAQRADTERAARPVATFKQGGVEVSVWKETTSFSPTDLAVVSQLTSHAFQEIVQLKSQSRAR